MLYEALAELESRNKSGALCTVIRTRGSTPRHATSKMLVYPDGRIVGTVGGGEIENRVIKEAQQAMIDGKPRLLEYNLNDPKRGDPGVCGGQMEIFVEPLHPKPTLVVIGAGHVGKAVVYLGRWLGFQVVVSDDRPEFCTPEAVPEADQYLPVSMKDIPQQLEITPQTYLVVTTRGVDVDVPGLPALLATSPGYIGVIGSKRRWETTKKQLLEDGVLKDSIESVHTPIGLDIKAETPEEIAVSIMSEIIKIRGNNDGGIIKDKR